MKKQFTALLLSLLMVLTLTPTTAFAQEEYTLTYSGLSNGLGSSNIFVSVDGGEKVYLWPSESLTISAASQVEIECADTLDNWLFDGWAAEGIDSTQIQDAESFSFTMPEGNVTLTKKVQDMGNPEAAIDNNGILTWNAVDGYESVARVYEKNGINTSFLLQSERISAGNGKYTFDLESALQQYEEINGSLGNVEVMIDTQYWKSSDPPGSSIRGQWENVLLYNRSGAQKLETPVNLRWDGFTARWDPVEHAAKYEVEINCGLIFITSATVADPAFDIHQVSNELTSGETYTFRVAAIPEDGSTEYMNGEFSQSSAKSEPYQLPPATVPAITFQPQDKTYTVGDAVGEISVEASISDGGTLSYQWYSNTTDSNSGGTKLDGETNSSYTPDISGAGMTYYYCVVTNTLNGTTAEAVSDTAKIEVKPVLEKYDLYIYKGNEYVGTRATSDNANDILEDGGTVSYDASTCTLTLNNAKITGILTYGNEQKTLTINVVGDCTIEAQRYNAIRLQGAIKLESGNRIYLRDKLIITGDGKLTVNALVNNTVGISTFDDVTINGANVEINSDDQVAIAVQTQNDPNQGDIDLNIINSTVTATTNSSAANVFWTQKGGIKINNSDVTVNAASSSYPTLWAATDIEIMGGSDVTATTGYGNALFSLGGIKIDGSAVAANGETSYNPAMYANSIEITGGSDVTATTGDGNAIWAADGGIIIDNSTVKAYSVGEYTSFSIYTYGGNLVVKNGSNLTAESAADIAIYVEGDILVADSAVTAIGTDYQGMIVYGALKVKNSTVNVSRKTDTNDPAIVAEQVNVEASEITADGGIKFCNYDTDETDNIAFSIIPASGKLMELKVDDANHDGSAAVHFNEGAESPYDATVNFDADAMNALYALKYIRIGEHTHAGGTATCTDPAVCDDCGRQYGDVDPDNHSFTNYVYNNDATCTADGTETAECDRCGSTDTREKVGSMLGHNAVKTEAKAATCTEGGNIEYWYCDVCGKYFRDAEGNTEITLADTVISATGHKLIHTPAKAATCTEGGNIEYWYCDVCGKYFSDAEGKTEITLADTVIKAVGHKLTKTPAKAATCTEDGNIEYWYCDVCGKYFSDAEGKTEITLADTVIKATGHKLTKTPAKAATCTEAGNTEYWTCDICGKHFRDAEGKTEITLADTVIKATGHSYKDGKCSICGASDPNYKPASPTGSDKQSNNAGKGSNSPQMGDDSNIALWSFIMLMAGTALAGTAVYTHKKKRSR